MKQLILMPLLLMVSGCVNYYYPIGQPVEGVQYVPAEEYVQDGYYEDESLGYTDFSGHYSSAQYYPWWSIDYFYLGSRHGHSNWSVGFGFNDPWYYSPYDPFYWSWYPSWHYTSWIYPRSYWYSPWRHSYGWNDWRPYYWHHRYARHHRSNHHDHDRYEQRRNNHGGHGDTVAFRDTQDRHRRRDEERGSSFDRRYGEDGPVPGRASGRMPGRGGPGSAAVNRQVSVAPGGGNRGVEIRNRSERKPGLTRPDKPAKPVVKLSPSDGITVNRSPQRGGIDRSRSSSGEVRSYSQRKGDQSRKKPMNPRPDVIASDMSEFKARPRPQPSKPVSPVRHVSPVVSYTPPGQPGRSASPPRSRSHSPDVRSAGSATAKRSSQQIRPQPARPTSNRGTPSGSATAPVYQPKPSSPPRAGRSASSESSYRPPSKSKPARTSSAKNPERTKPRAKKSER